MTGTARLSELHSAEEVRARIEALADQIHAELREPRPLLLAIAEGARRFATSLAQALQARGRAPEVLFLTASRTRSRELVEVELGPLDASALTDRELLVVDDIADEGRTLQAVVERALDAKPRSLRTAVLVDKRASRRTEVQLDYVGFVVEAGWVVGYGMDLDGAFRELDRLALADCED